MAKEIKIEFQPGDSIQIVKDGCNNSSAPEHSQTAYAGKTIYKVERVETTGKYTSELSKEYYTLILDTGQPVWACHCKKVIIKEPLFPIF